MSSDFASMLMSRMCLTGEARVRVLCADAMHSAAWERWRSLTHDRERMKYGAKPDKASDLVSLIAPSCHLTERAQFFGLAPLACARRSRNSL